MAGVSGRAWITRDHVLAQVADARLVLLEAPGGWGKTTLAEQLLDRDGVAAARVRLRDETSLPSLLAAGARALRRAGLGDLSELLAVDDGDAAADALLAALARRRDPVAIVVDEAQLVDADSAAWLRSVADDLAPPHRLIVAGRRLDRVLTRRPPSGSVLLGVDDLRFTVGEVAVALGDRAELADAVHARTAGWATAVVLAARAPEVSVGFGPALVDALLDDVLGDDRAAFASVARLPLLSADVVDLVAGPRAFDRFVASGLPLESNGGWLVLPDTIREALGPGEPPAAATAAAVAARYDIATAVAYLTAEGRIDVLADDLARRHWSELLELGAGELAAVVETVPDGVLRERPEVLVAAVRASEWRDLARRTEWIDRGLALSTSRPDDERAVAAGRQLRLERARDLVRDTRLDDADELAVSVLADASPDAPALRGRALFIRGVVAALRASAEQLDVADAQLSEAASLFRMAGERRWEADALNRLAVTVTYRRGDLPLAAEQMAQSLALLQTGSRDWALGLTYYADILDRLGRATEAEAAGRDAWEWGTRRGDAVVTAFGAWSLAMVRAHLGDVDGTWRWLRETEQHPGTWFAAGHGQEFLAFGADLLGAVGEEAGARAYRARLAERVAAGGPPAHLDLVDARIESMFGDPERAIDALDRLRGSPLVTLDTEWTRVLFRALATLRLGHRTEATRLIERALRMTVEQQLPDLPFRQERLLVQLLAEVWPGGGVAATPTGTARIVMLGTFAVLRGSTPATPAPGNPSTLVKVVALRGSLTAEQAIDLLWPDADLGTGRARLRNLLNRIRSQCGEVLSRQADALTLADGVSTDVAEFEESVAAVFAAPPSDRAGTARLALGGYAGDLLPGDAYEDWSAAPRERLRRRYLSLVDIVADDAIARGDLDEAMRLLDLGVEREPLEERRYLVAAEALLAAGRRAAARDIVQRAANALGEVGLPLGADLERIGRSLDVALTR